MLSEVWIFLSVLLILIGLVASQGLLLVVGSLVIVVALVARLWDRFAFRRVTHTRNFSRQRAFIGDSLEYSVTLYNDKILPLIWVDIRDAFPDGLELAGGHLRSAGMEMAQQHIITAPSACEVVTYSDLAPRKPSFPKPTTCWSIPGWLTCSS